MHGYNPRELFCEPFITFLTSPLTALMRTAPAARTAAGRWRRFTATAVPPTCARAFSLAESMVRASLGDPRCDRGRTRLRDGLPRAGHFSLPVRGVSAEGARAEEESSARTPLGDSAGTDEPPQMTRGAWRSRGLPWRVCSLVVLLFASLPLVTSRGGSSRAKGEGVAGTAPAIHCL